MFGACRALPAHVHVACNAVIPLPPSLSACLRRGVPPQMASAEDVATEMGCHPRHVKCALMSASSVSSPRQGSLAEAASLRAHRILLARFCHKNRCCAHLLCRFLAVLTKTDDCPKGLPGAGPVKVLDALDGAGPDITIKQVCQS